MENKIEVQVTSLTQIERDKEVKSIFGEANDLAGQINEFNTIESADDLRSASELMIVGQKVLKAIDARRRFFTDPHNLFVKAINNFFAGPADPLDNAIAALRSRMAQYQRQVEEEARKREAEILAKQEKGKISEKTAVKQLANVERPQEVTRTAAGAVSFREDKKLKIVDVKKIPREYLVPDERFILAALKAGKVIPGCELEIVKVPVGRGGTW